LSGLTDRSWPTADDSLGSNSIGWRIHPFDPLLPFTDGRYLEARLHAVATR
jgi:hypothetical protein